ncbi:hypothetical protein Vspart_04393 [Vibrio spartinae]|uniref:Uncharacterized protein n=1 Tax=Vibrio spartinae TaxID=1918945 RepID=A0ABX6R5Z7_9VIBR|nr:hypothetical protein Vspart_04393 [Vibrio spartinae]
MWRVPSEKIDEFQNIWRSATDNMHRSVEAFDEIEDRTR